MNAYNHHLLSAAPKYPSLLKCYVSNFIDRAVTYTFIAALLIGFEEIASDSILLKFAALFIGMSYEPLLLASNRRTVGQIVMRIRVQQLSLGKRLTLANAFARFWIRMLLGWATYITLHTNKERRALHDIVTDTVMVSL